MTQSFSTVACLRRAVSISLLSLATLLTGAEASAQSRSGGFQNSFRGQVFGRSGSNRPLAVRPFARNNSFQRQSFSRANRPNFERADRSRAARELRRNDQINSATNVGRRNSDVPRAITNPDGTAVQVVPFVAPQTPPAKVIASRGVGNNPLPLAPPPKTGKQGSGQSEPQFIVLPNTPPADRAGRHAPRSQPVLQQVANLGPVPSNRVATTAFPLQPQSDASVESVGPVDEKSLDQTTGVPAKPRVVVKHFVVKVETRYYHVKKTPDDEYKLMGYVDSDFQYHKWRR